MEEDEWNKEHDENDAHDDHDHSEDEEDEDGESVKEKKVDDTIGVSFKLDYTQLEEYMVKKRFKNLFDGESIELTEIRTIYQLRKIKVGF